MNELKKQKVGFTQVANIVLNDKNLSLKAKGLYSYIYSKPDGWDFAYRRIANDQKDGKASVLTALQELENAGYIRRQKQNSGRVLYHILVDSVAYLMPQPENRTQPKPENRRDRKSQRPKIGLISNKECEVIKSKSNKDILKETRQKLEQRGVIQAKR